MKIAFNARLLSSPTLRGWNRYTVNLLAELPALGVELFLCSDRPLHEDHLARLPKGSATVRVAPPMRFPQWEQQWLPRQCASDRVQVLHSPFNLGLPWFCPCPRVLTLHDAIAHVYPEPQPLRKRLGKAALSSRFYHWVARTRADRVITVSEYSRQDLIRHLGIPASKVAVTLEAADPLFTAPVSEQAKDRVRSAHGLNKPYVFYVGGWEMRKNVPFLVRAFALAAIEGVDLVLAGGREEQRADMVELAGSLNLGDRLRLLNWVEEADLPALYAGALGFAYPSAYEGFGLQLCEAMAVGCPTLAARATSLPEVLSDGGETFTLDDPRELAGQLSRLAADPAYQADLTRRARSRSAKFTWRHTAQQTVAVYRGLIEK